MGAFYYPESFTWGGRANRWAQMVFQKFSTACHPYRCSVTHFASSLCDLAIPSSQLVTLNLTSLPTITTPQVPHFEVYQHPNWPGTDPNILLSLFTSSWFLPWNNKGFSTPWPRIPNLQSWDHLRTQDSSLLQTLRLIPFRVRSLLKNPEVWHDLPQGRSLSDLTPFSVRTSLTTRLQVAHVSLPWYSSSFCSFLQSTYHHLKYQIFHKFVLFNHCLSSGG